MLKYGMQNSKIFNIWGGGTAPSPDPTPRRPMAIDRNGNFLFHALVARVEDGADYLRDNNQSDSSQIMFALSSYFQPKRTKRGCMRIATPQIRLDYFLFLH